jgi:hypothetical protein
MKSVMHGVAVAWAGDRLALAGSGPGGIGHVSSDIARLAGQDPVGLTGPFPIHTSP